MRKQYESELPFECDHGRLKAALLANRRFATAITNWTKNMPQLKLSSDEYRSTPTTMNKR